MNQLGSQFAGSLQHHDFFPGGHYTYTRCESCMYGQHFEVVTWHSWAGIDDIEHAEETGQDVAKIKSQKCACDCAGPRGALQEPVDVGTETLDGVPTPE